MTGKTIALKDIKLHYLEQGVGEVVLMIHGFPTSSYLWRNIIPEIAKTHRAIAIDLPGYGQSDKPNDASYSLNYYLQILNEFLGYLDIKSLHLIVHDLGGPIGLLWATRNVEKVKSLILLNTLVYSKLSWGVILFGIMLKTPIARNWLVSPAGIRWTLRLGTVHKMGREVVQTYCAPFIKKLPRRILRKTASNISIKGFKEIENGLKKFTFPVGVIYGSQDRVLPKVAHTMTRLQNDIPHLQTTALPECGHFLQEDDPRKVSELISEFLN